MAGPAGERQSAPVGENPMAFSLASRRRGRASPRRMSKPAPARILIAEDIATMALVIQRLLRERGHFVRHVGDGSQALERLRAEPFDLLVTDWVMPVMDGVELILRLRAELRDPPPIVMQTAVDTADAREAVLEVGADEYLAKPWSHEDLVTVVERCLARRRAPRVRVTPRNAPRPRAAAPFPCVCLAASTGGPVTMRGVLEALPSASHAAFVVVVHGPAWMLESYAKQLARTCAMPVELAATGTLLVPDRIFVAPGDRHTVVDAHTRRLQVVDMPPENWVRPAADPLFRTAAAAFGRAVIGVVMTGLGRDGTRGAATIVGAGGRVIVQEPASCIASPMPSSVIDAGVPCRVVPAGDIANAITAALMPLVESP